MSERFIWVEIAPGRKRLVDTTKPRASAPARSSLRFPMIGGSFAEPVQSMADGKYYSSARSLERTYRADGNPQGVEYECVGDAEAKPFERPKRTREQEDKANQAISRAIDEAGI